MRAPSESSVPPFLGWKRKSNPPSIPRDRSRVEKRLGRWKSMICVSTRPTRFIQLEKVAP